MTYDDVKRVEIPFGKDSKLFEIITSDGELYHVFSKTTDGAKLKLNRYLGKSVNIVYIQTLERGVL